MSNVVVKGPGSPFFWQVFLARPTSLLDTSFALVPHPMRWVRDRQNCQKTSGLYRTWSHMCLSKPGFKMHRSRKISYSHHLGMQRDTSRWLKHAPCWMTWIFLKMETRRKSWKYMEVMPVHWNHLSEVGEKGLNLSGGQKARGKIFRVGG